MEISSVPHHHKDCRLHQNCVTLYQCGYPSSEGYSSLSPASSTDSCGLSPPYMTFKTSEDTCGNIPACSTRTDELRMDSKYVSEKKSKKSKVKLAHSQRQSASEREKLRMRNLSKALQNLRRYLPPSVAPADKNLTKIETLQLTIRYIAHLSEQLGLSEEVLEQRRMAAIQGTKKCPQSIHCCLDRTHRLCSEATEESVNQVLSANPFGQTGHFPIQQEMQHVQAGQQLSYQMPQLTELESASQHQHYSATSVTLDQYARQYYTTDFQQMIINEDYTDLGDTWRREQSHVYSSK